MKPLMSETRTAVIGALIVALGSVSMALYTPAMPTLVEVLQTTPAAIKMSLSVYLFGFAFAQLVCGPLSDAFGRRPVALGFFSIYVLGSVIAVVSPSITWLLIGRALQGIGVAAGVAISRAIVRDQFTGQSSARIMNLIGLMLAVGPAVSPTIGGVLLSTLGWHSIFLVMVVYGIVALLVMGFWCVETNVAPNPAQAYPGQILRNYAMLLRDRGFMRGSLVLGCAVGAFYTMAVILPFVLMEKIGLTPTQFGLVMLAQTGSYALGAAVTGRLLRRIEVMRLVPIGLILDCCFSHGVWHWPAPSAALLVYGHGPCRDLGLRRRTGDPRRDHGSPGGLSEGCRCSLGSRRLSADWRWACWNCGCGPAVQRSPDGACDRDAQHGSARDAGAFCSPAEARKSFVRGRPRGAGNSGRSRGSVRRWRRGDRESGAPETDGGESF